MILIRIRSWNTTLSEEYFESLIDMRDNDGMRESPGEEDYGRLRNLK